MADNALATLLQLEQEARQCEGPQALFYLMANRTRALVPYDQAAVVTGHDYQRLTLRALSDTAILDKTAPYAAWLERRLRTEDRQGRLTEAATVSTRDWPRTDQAMLSEHSPPYLLWLPLVIPSRPGERLGGLWLARSAPWQEKEVSLLTHLCGSYAHAMQVFDRKKVTRSWAHWRKRKLVGWTLVGLVVAFLAWPVRLSVLAPAEVVAKNPARITAPMEGSIETVLVQPGDRVAADQALARMDATQLTGQLEVAERDWWQARAALKTAEQAGYADREAKGRIAELKAQVALKEAEKTFAAQQLARSTLKAPAPGLVILKNPSDWEGRPVTVGERIMSVANPERVQLKIWLPVADAIALDEGTTVRLYLDNDPLNPVTASLRYSVYESEVTPDQVVAFKVMADFEDGVTPRIGLRGTAKLYGETVSMAYYLFRRPLTTVRQWTGW